jgi:divalent metal cation (Fe/Co/Zn/Cd) transporter
VVDVLELKTMYVGPKSLVVAARVDLRDGLDAGRVEELATRIDRELLEAVPTVRGVFLDPTGSRGG